MVAISDDHYFFTAGNTMNFTTLTMYLPLWTLRNLCDHCGLFFHNPGEAAALQASFTILVVVEAKSS